MIKLSAKETRGALEGWIGEKIMVHSGAWMMWGVLGRDDHGRFTVRVSDGVCWAEVTFTNIDSVDYPDGTPRIFL